MCNWNTFGARMSHGHRRTHKTHHDLDLKEATTFPFIIFPMIGHGGYTQMSFFSRTPKLEVSKFLKLGFLPFWTPITSFEDL